MDDDIIELDARARVGDGIVLCKGKADCSVAGHGSEIGEGDHGTERRNSSECAAITALIQQGFGRGSCAGRVNKFDQEGIF